PHSYHRMGGAGSRPGSGRLRHARYSIVGPSSRARIGRSGWLSHRVQEAREDGMPGGVAELSKATRIGTGGRPWPPVPVPNRRPGASRLPTASLADQKKTKDVLRRAILRPFPSYVVAPFRIAASA